MAATDKFFIVGRRFFVIIGGIKHMAISYIVTVKYYDNTDKRNIITKKTIVKAFSPQYARDCAFVMMKKRKDIITADDVINVYVRPEKLETYEYTSPDLGDTFEEDISLNDVISETYYI